MSAKMGPLDSLGATPIEAHDIPASKWESSGTDRRLDMSDPSHAKEGSKEDRAADNAARRAVNARINGKRR